MTRTRIAVAAISAVLLVPLAACDDSVSPSNTARTQATSAGQVTAKKHYGAKSYWLQVDRDGVKSWGKVRLSSYHRCAVGEHWPTCKEATR